MEKIKKIIKHLKKQINQKFSKIEVFNIFKDNKRTLLFILKEIIENIEDISIGMKYEGELKGKDFYIYFYPEIKSIYGEEKFKSIIEPMIENDSDIFDDFEKKRQEGKNNSYICSLIRQDSVEEFISYINRNNISPSSKIKTSIFETNKLFIKKMPTLIEYSAFYCSIQIFDFL